MIADGDEPSPDPMFRTVVECTDDAIYVKDHNSRLLYLNPASLRLVGKPASELVGRTDAEFYDDPAIGQAILEHDRHIMESGKATAFEETIETPRGLRVMWSVKVPWLSEAGRLMGLIGISRDITDRKAEADALLRSNERLRTAFRAALAGAWEWDLATDAVEWSPELARLFGQPDDAQGSYANWLRAVHPDDRQRVDEASRTANAQAGGVDYTFRIVRPDGAIRWIHSLGTVVPGLSGRSMRVVGFAMDVTRQKEAEARFSLLARTASRLLGSPDPQRVVQELCLEVMEHLDCHAFFNFLLDEPSGRLRLNACAGIPPGDARSIEWLDVGVAVCGCVARDGERIVAEEIQGSTDRRTDLVRGYGIQAYCCHPLKAQGRTIGTLSFGTRTRPRFQPDEIEVMRTIADQVSIAMQRVQSEAALKATNHQLEDLARTLEERVAERTAEVTTLARQLRQLASEATLTEHRERQRLAKVLHDHVQQLLVAAKLHAGMLVHRQADAGLSGAARVVNDLLDQTLAASRSLTAELSPPVLFDSGLGPALQWLARSFLEKHGLTVDVQFDAAAEPLLEETRVFLFDSIRELLFNTVKHAGVNRARLAVTRDADARIRVVVADEGAGFDPVGRSRQTNGGFGLFSIQQRLQHLGGRMEIDSGAGLGTRITLHAPPPPPVQQLRREVRPDVAGGATEIAAPAVSGSIIRVVLADDHHIMRQGLAGLLSMEPGIEVVGQAADGAEAITLARTLRPDVVVMDINMPGLNGIESTREILREQPGIRVVGLSMHEEGELATEMKEAGAVGYVTKGGPPEALISAIHAAFLAPAPHGQPATKASPESLSA